MLIAADHALESAVEAGDRTSERADTNFRKAIELLRAFEKRFPFKDPTSGPNICRTTLYALENNLHSKVKFLSVS